MHSEKNIDKAWAVTCGLGFDLICDYGAWMDTNRRTIIKMLGIFGRIITTSKSLQIDQPESSILSQLNAQIIYTSNETMIESGMYDGVIRTIV